MNKKEIKKPSVLVEWREGEEEHVHYGYINGVKVFGLCDILPDSVKLFFDSFGWEDYYKEYANKNSA